jgi:hypothetical protein
MEVLKLDSFYTLQEAEGDFVFSQLTVISDIDPCPIQSANSDVDLCAAPCNYYDYKKL